MVYPTLVIAVNLIKCWVYRGIALKAALTLVRISKLANRVTWSASLSPVASCD